MNAQHSTLNAQRSSVERVYDSEERLLDYAVRIIRVAESMKRSAAGLHIADQLLRSGTSPYGNYGEAEGAESRDDFVHKLRVWLREKILTSSSASLIRPSSRSGISINSARCMSLNQRRDSRSSLKHSNRNQASEGGQP